MNTVMQTFTLENTKVGDQIARTDDDGAPGILYTVVEIDAGSDGVPPCAICVDGYDDDPWHFNFPFTGWKQN